MFISNCDNKIWHQNQAIITGDIWSKVLIKLMNSLFENMYCTVRKLDLLL
jgi:hypothetical protein